LLIAVSTLPPPRAGSEIRRRSPFLILLGWFLLGDPTLDCIYIIYINLFTSSKSSITFSVFLSIKALKLNMNDLTGRVALVTGASGG